VPMKAGGRDARAGGAWGLLLFACLAATPGAVAAWPEGETAPPWGAKGYVRFDYAREELRPRASTEKYARSSVQAEVTRRASEWMTAFARVAASGPWRGRYMPWRLNDVAVGSSLSHSVLSGKLDLAAFVSVAGPVGQEPGESPWYGGLADWGYASGGKVSAALFGRGAPGELRATLFVRYNSRRRAGWIYFPRHSVAVADSSGGGGGPVTEWGGGVELRSEQASLATSVVVEDPHGGAGAVASSERPLYVIQSAAVGITERIGLSACGEILLSRDDAATLFEPRSALPLWTVSVGLVWTYQL